MTFAIVFMMGPLPQGAIAQDAATIDQVSQEEINKFKTRIEAATDLDPTVSKTILENLKAASDTLAVIEGLKARENEALKQLENIEPDQAKRKADLETAQTREPRVPHISDTLSELEQRLAELQRELADAQSQLTKIDNDIEERNARIKSMKERLAQIPADAAKNDAEVAKLDTSTEPQVIVESKRLQLLAIRRQLQQEPATIQAELSSIEARAAAKLLQTDRQVHALNVAVVKKEVDAWSAAVSTRREEIARDRRKQAEEMASQTDNVGLKEVFMDNAEIVTEELEIRNELQSKKSDVDAVIKRREKLDEEWSLIRKREARVRTSKSFGIRLRQQRNLLPNPQALRDENRTRAFSYEKIQLDYLQKREDRRELDDLQAVVEEYTAKLRPSSKNVTDLDDEEKIARDQQEKAFKELVTTAFRQKSSFLDDAINAYEDYIEALDSLDYEQEALAQLSQEYANYIDEKVLWIPSHEPLTPTTVFEDVSSLRKLADGAVWFRVLKFFMQDFVSTIWTRIAYLVASIVWILLLVCQPFQKASIKACGKQAASRLNTSLTPTNRALLWTTIKSLVYPLPLLFLSWRAISGGASPETLVLTRHLRHVALGLIFFEFIRNVCRPYGLGTKHFGWSEKLTRSTSIRVSSFLALASPILIVIAVLRSRSQDGDLDSIERACSVAVFLLAAHLLHHLTNRRNGIISEWVSNNPDRWLSQLAFLFHYISIAIPVFLAGLTVMGYTYAAQQIAIRLGATFSLTFLVIFLYSYLARWLMLGQRRRAIREARALRAEMAKSDDQPTTLPEVDKDRSTLHVIGEQTRRLLSSVLTIVMIIGLWMIWNDVLPALKYFDQWTLPGSSIAITSLGLAVLAACICISAARNIPGLLEVLLLERLPFDRSARYAIKAVTQYVIILMGVISVAHLMGIGWDQVQWLAAALTFGLGFGLQEIFANFISGLIILFEQPVRVGDIVTIDGVSGVVNRIRIRSTTITDWDRKEYIVPNKEFITGRLLNWTLTDTINRIVITVGVAYGSNPEQVRSVIKAVLDKTQPLMTDPPPIITFDGFGDSSLDFTVRVFLPNIEPRLEVINSLHTDIYNALAEADIEIPFPQRDLHVRSITTPTPQEVLEELESASKEQLED